MALTYLVFLAVGLAALQWPVRGRKRQIRKEGLVLFFLSPLVEVAEEVVGIELRTEKALIVLVFGVRITTVLALIGVSGCSESGDVHDSTFSIFRVQNGDPVEEAEWIVKLRLETPVVSATGEKGE